MSLFDETAAEELRHLFLGRQIANGAARKVFVLRQDPNLVAKFETEGGSFQNVMEWEVWERVRYTKHAAWFAPCIDISPSGLWLIQKRTEPIAKDQYPQHVPCFFTDLKYSNFGMIDGRFVCHDYGLHRMFERGMTKRMRKADWWE